MENWRARRISGTWAPAGAAAAIRTATKATTENLKGTSQAPGVRRRTKSLPRARRAAAFFPQMALQNSEKAKYRNTELEKVPGPIGPGSCPRSGASLRRDDL